MKKIIISLLSVLFLSISNSQAQITKDEYIVQDELPTNTRPINYQLFPTENMWTFIKLNTRNGQMWQVQFDVQDNNRFETFLNILPLIDKEKEVDERFTLYPTQNRWTFILLDQIDGKTWQVQWSMNAENRFVIPIDE